MSRQRHDLETRHNARITIRTLRSTLSWLAASLMLGAFLPGCTEPPKPGNILVVQPGNFETKGDGKLFRVDPANGARSVLSDFSDTAQGLEGVDPFDVAVEPSGYILVTDPNGEDAKGKLFRVDPKNGVRTVLSDFGNTAQGAVGANPLGVAVDLSGHIVVTDPRSGKDSNGALLRVDAKSGARTLLSDFGDPAQGTPGGQIGGVAVEPSGHILVTAFETGTESKGALFRVDAKSGARTLLSDFGNPAQGALGEDPFSVAVEAAGPILVMDANAGTDRKGALFRVDPTSGARTVLSDFGNPAQGPEGVVRDIPFPFIDVAVEPSGDVLVTAVDTGTDKQGVLFRVDATSGARRILSDFGDSGQGPLGQNPLGVAVAQERK